MDGLRLCAVALLVVLAASGPVAATGATGQSAGTGPDSVDVTYTVAHDPEGPSIEATMAVAMPDRVTEFTARLPPAVEVTATDGFDRTDEGFVWDGETDTPSIEYTVPNDSERTLVTEAYAYASFADVVGYVGFRYREPEVEYSREVEVAGDGAVHGYAVSLWQNATTVESADGTEITVVTPPSSGPGAVEPNATRRRVVAETLAEVDEFFSFDRTDDRIVVFLRPSNSLGLEGPVAGRANTAGQILLEAPNATDTELLAHEWVHTQQDFRPAAATDWFMEGSADYFANYYSYHAGEQSFEEFRETLNVRGEEYADVNLRELTNASETADYRKGRHVAAALDALIRNRSDGEASLADLLVELRERDGGDPTFGDGPAVSTSAFVEATETTADSTVAFWYDAATGDSEPPALPEDPAAFSHRGEVPATAPATPTATTTPNRPGTPDSTPPSGDGGEGGMTATATATATETTAPTATPGQPGFTPLVLAAAALLVAWRRK